MTQREQLEAWKTLAIAYEVMVETAAEIDAPGLSASMKAVRKARAVLIDAGLMSDEPDPK